MISFTSSATKIAWREGTRGVDETDDDASASRGRDARTIDRAISERASERRSLNRASAATTTIAVVAARERARLRRVLDLDLFLFFVHLDGASARALFARDAGGHGAAPPLARGGLRGHGAVRGDAHLLLA